ncbi:FHA domain protein [compost metagenome]
MAHPGTGMLIVSVLMTVLFGIIAWLGWQGKLRMPMNREEPFTDSVPLFDSGELESSRLVRKKTSFQVEHVTGFFGGRSQGKELEPSRERWVFPDSPTIEQKAISDTYDEGNSVSNIEDTEVDYYTQLGHRTEILSAPRMNATVLLNPEQSASEEHHGRHHSFNPFLERREVGQAVIGGINHGNSTQDNLLPLRIELNYPHFIIGRAADIAQFIEESQGTSRAHVELSKGSDGYVIKDLGSKNGTLLNKELMVAYKEYPLHDGDIFTVVKGEYTYHLRA